MDGGGNKSDPYVKVSPIWIVSLINFLCEGISILDSKLNPFNSTNSIYNMHQWFSSMCNLTPGDSDGEQAEDESVEAREEPHLWRVQQHVPVFCEHIFQNILCNRLRIIMSYIWTSQVNPQGTDIFFEVGNLFRISLTNSTVVFHLYWERKISFIFVPLAFVCLFVRLMCVDFVLCLYQIYIS